MNPMIREDLLQVPQARDDSDYILKGQAVYIYVRNWTLCKHLVVQFPCDSVIPVFARILKGQSNTRGTKPRKPLRGCDGEIAYLYYYILNPRKTVIRHTW